LLILKITNYGLSKYIVERACDGIVVLDRSGTIIVFNKVARKIVKKSTDQVI